MKPTNPYSTDNPLVNEEDLKDHLAIGAVIHNIKNPDEILVFKHVKYGWWTIPIGKVKEGDSVDLTLRTELGEEIGIVPDEYTEMGHFGKNYDRGNGIKTKITQYIFDIHTYIGRIKNKEPDKHTDLMWMTVKELLAIGHISDATLLYIIMKD